MNLIVSCLQVVLIINHLIDFGGQLDLQVLDLLNEVWVALLQFFDFVASVRPIDNTLWADNCSTREIEICGQFIRVSLTHHTRILLLLLLIHFGKVFLVSQRI